MSRAVFRIARLVVFVGRAGEVTPLTLHERREQLLLLPGHVGHLNGDPARLLGDPVTSRIGRDAMFSVLGIGVSAGTGRTGSPPRRRASALAGGSQSIRNLL
jgi:hypothetical protein